MLTSSTSSTSSIASISSGTTYNFPVSGTNGLLVLCLSPGASSDTITVTTSCTKGTTFTVKCNRGSSSAQYAMAIIPVTNFTTSSTFKYTSSNSKNGTGWVIYS